MPELQPSCLKPGDAPKLKGAKVMSQESKARAYEQLRPGTGVSEGQAAERYERMQFRAENGVVNRRRRSGHGSITVPALPWLDKD